MPRTRPSEDMGRLQPDRCLRIVGANPDRPARTAPARKRCSKSSSAQSIPTGADAGRASQARRFARKAHFQRLALKSAKARRLARKRRPGSTTTGAA